MKNLKKPVCISLNDPQIERIDTRAKQTRLNRSKQIQRDLSAYWAMLDAGLETAHALFTLSEIQYLAQIFRGKTLVPSDDVLWTSGELTRFVQRSTSYGDAELANSIAKKLRYKSDRFTQFSILDWLRRAAINHDDPTLYEGWLDTSPCETDK